MKSRILAILCFAALMPLAVHGQRTDNVDEAAAAKIDSHAAAIEEFFVAMKMQQTTDKMIDQMMAMQIQQQPQLASFKGVMMGFLRKYVSYEALKADMVKLYKVEFSEAEIREMTVFYRSPVGQKAVAKLPALTESGAQLGIQRVQANMGELQQAIIQRQEELKQQ